MFNIRRERKKEEERERRRAAQEEREREREERERESRRRRVSSYWLSKVCSLRLRCSYVVAISSSGFETAGAASVLLLLFQCASELELLVNNNYN